MQTRSREDAEPNPTPDNGGSGDNQILTPGRSAFQTEIGLCKAAKNIVNPSHICIGLFLIAIVVMEFNLFGCGFELERVGSIETVIAILLIVFDRHPLEPE